MIDAILSRLGFVRTERAKAWAVAAHDDCTERAKKAIAGEREVSRRSYFRGQLVGRNVAETEIAGRINDLVRAKAGELEAERNGYKAQLDLAERKLKLANELLEGAGRAPVLNFLCPDYPTH